MPPVLTAEAINVTQTTAGFRATLDVPPEPPAPALLLEDGSYILMEDGSRLLLE